MEEYKNIEESILELSQGSIVAKKRNFVFPLLLLLVGACLLLIDHLGIDVAFDALHYILLLIGIGLCCWGLARLAVRGNYYEYQPTRQRLTKQVVHLDPDEVHRYQTLFTEGQFEEIVAEKIDHSTTLMCELWSTKDNQVACAQLIEYKGFRSVALTPARLLVKAG